MLRCNLLGRCVGSTELRRYASMKYPPLWVLSNTRAARGAPHRQLREYSYRQFFGFDWSW